MSESVMGWIFGGWLFGPSHSSGRQRKQTIPDRETAARATPRAAASQTTVGGVPLSELLTQLQAGNRDALATVYDALFPTLWRLAMLRTRSVETAEEIVHDVFLSLWIRRATLRRDLDIHVYLAAAVRNRTRDLYEHEQVVRAVEAAVDHAVLDAPAMSQGLPRVDAAVESDEFWAAYRKALSTLTDREREAVLLRWEERFTLGQIAQVLGLSIMGARAVILRAQQKVQGALSDYTDLVV